MQKATSENQPISEKQRQYNAAAYNQLIEPFLKEHELIVELMRLDGFQAAEERSRRIIFQRVGQIAREQGKGMLMAAGIVACTAAQERSPAHCWGIEQLEEYLRISFQHLHIQKITASQEYGSDLEKVVLTSGFILNQLQSQGLAEFFKGEMEEYFRNELVPKDDFLGSPNITREPR